MKLHKQEVFMSWNDYSPFRKRETITPIRNEITVFGTTWCGMTQMVRRFLERKGIPYTYKDIEDDPGAEKQLRWITGGYKNHPTVVIDGQALIEPELEELEEALSQNGYV